MPDTDDTPKGTPVTIHAQYLRDLSFENPNAPGALRSDGSAPEMDIKIGIEARKMPDIDGVANLHEVVLSLRAEAKRGAGDDAAQMFIAEMQYGIAASIPEGAVPDDQVHPFLYIEVPRMAFPFARQILADVTVRGGYPPLLLQPVDFRSLYAQRFGDQADAGD
jgi:preprotein translocase subunit SecB